MWAPAKIFCELFHGDRLSNFLLVLENHNLHHKKSSCQTLSKASEISRNAPSYRLVDCNQVNFKCNCSNCATLESFGMKPY